MKPLISIIIPCYNSSTYLAETLTNVLAQSYPDFECILVDDGSTDNTKLIANDFAAKDKRIHYYQQNNGGVSTARNAGIKFSIGEFIQFLDADDLMPPEKLKIHAEYLLSHPEVDIVFTEYVQFNKAEVLTPEFVANNKNNFTKKTTWEKENILKYLVLDNIMCPHAALSRRKVADTIGFDPNLRHCEDYDFWFRSAISGFHFSYLENPGSVCFYRKHPGNKSSNSARMYYYRTLVKQKELTVIHERYPEFYTALFDSFLLNQKRYLFDKSKKNFNDVVYTLKLSLKHKSVRLILIDLQYLIIPNRIWRLVHWNGGLLNYIKTKIKK